MEKSPEAFRTISEVADWLKTPAHVLRFWETRFSQIRPVKRAGGRRYYRPDDMRLIGGIKKLLHDDGMTIRGVQKILKEQGVAHVASLSCPLSDTPSAKAEIRRAEERAARRERLAERARKASEPVSPHPPVEASPHAGNNVVPLTRTSGASGGKPGPAAQPSLPFDREMTTPEPVPEPVPAGKPSAGKPEPAPLVESAPSALEREKLARLHARLKALRDRVLAAAR